MALEVAISLVSRADGGLRTAVLGTANAEVEGFREGLRLGLIFQKVGMLGGFVVCFWLSMFLSGELADPIRGSCGKHAGCQIELEVLRCSVTISGGHE